MSWKWWFAGAAVVVTLAVVIVWTVASALDKEKW